MLQPPPSSTLPPPAMPCAADAVDRQSSAAPISPLAARVRPALASASAAHAIRSQLFPCVAPTSVRPDLPAGSSAAAPPRRCLSLPPLTAAARAHPDLLKPVVGPAHADLPPSPPPLAPAQPRPWASAPVHPHRCLAPRLSWNRVNSSLPPPIPLHRTSSVALYVHATAKDLLPNSQDVTAMLSWGYTNRQSGSSRTLPSSSTFPD